MPDGPDLRRSGLIEKAALLLCRDLARNGVSPRFTRHGDDGLTMLFEHGGEIALDFSDRTLRACHVPKDEVAILGAILVARFDWAEEDRTAEARLDM